MKSKLCAALLVCAAFALGGCSGPSYTMVVNNTGLRLVMTYATRGLSGAGENYANGSPWFWPVRTDPLLQPGGAHRLTAYCYGCMADWTVELRAGACVMRFEIPAPPDDAYERGDWKVFAAYGDAVVQLDRDLRLYRIPAYPGYPARSVALIGQPEGYPLAATSQEGCTELSPT